MDEETLESQNAGANSADSQGVVKQNATAALQGAPEKSVASAESVPEVAHPAATSDLAAENASSTKDAPKEISQEDLSGLNPEYEQRFGTKTGLKKGIMGTVGVLGGSAVGGGIGAAIDGSLPNLNESGKLNLGGAGGVVGGALGMVLGIKGIISGSNRLDLARKHGDKAGKAIAKEDIASNSVGLTKGAISTASAGVQFAGAAGNIGVGVAKGVASGLGAATGAVTIAEGLFKGGVDAMHLHKTRTFKPLSGKGEGWKDHIVNKKWKRVGVNALKVIGGALGVAGSVMTGGALALGFAAASAGIGIGMSLLKVGKGMNQREKMKAARKRQEAEELKQDKDKKFDKTISKDNIAKSNELRKTTKTGSIAFEMIESVKKASNLDKIRAAHITSQSEPSIKDKMFNFFKSMWAGNEKNSNKRRMNEVEEKQKEAKIELAGHSDEEKQSYDAHELLTAIGVSKGEATSGSGQELIEKKISVTNSL